jgi:thymidylate kinase
MTYLDETNDNASEALDLKAENTIKTVFSKQKENVKPAGDRPSDIPILKLVEELCKTLAREHISYCHWKSNNALDRSASGENDLDLLIDRADVQRFTEILYRLDFKEARPKPDKELPGVLNYYGHDTDTGRFVHIHAHYQLILGDDASKNYRLPIEGPYLASVVQGELFKVPSIEFELIVFVIRMMLKHSTWDAMLSFHGRLSKSARQELDYLMARADQQRMQENLSQSLPFLDSAVFDRCLRSLQPGASLISRYKAGKQLHRQLQAHARSSRLSDTCLKMWHRGLWGTRKYLLRRPTKKYLIHGGAIIALVGGDGAGKSTAVNELHGWLSKRFAAKKIHLGKPRWALSTLLVKGVLKIGRKLGLFSNRKVPAQPQSDAQPLELPGYGWFLWHVVTARDRYRTYARARRLATNGGLVICDRYPLPQIKTMDGAQTGRFLQAAKNKPLINLLIKWETKYYRHILPPDLLIVMKVDPDIAVQRRAGEDADWIRGRSQEIWGLDWQDAPVQIMDAGMPQARMLAELKSLVWSRL